MVVRSAENQFVQEEKLVDGARRLHITVNEGNSTISIIAENRFAAIVPAIVRLRWRG